MIKYSTPFVFNIEIWVGGGGVALADALKENKTLRHIYCEHNDMKLYRFTDIVRRWNRWLFTWKILQTAPWELACLTLVEYNRGTRQHET